MLDFVNRFIKSIVGSKADRDLKELSPFVGTINAQFDTLRSISNDDLRERTLNFKQRIRNHLEEIEQELASLSTEA